MSRSRVRVDRIDGKGNIREHALGEREGTTLCGLGIAGWNVQSPCGNTPCGRCAVIEAMRAPMERVPTWAACEECHGRGFLIYLDEEPKDGDLYSTCRRCGGVGVEPRVRGERVKG